VTSRLSRFILPAMIAVGCSFAVYVAVVRPAYFSNAEDLGSLLFFQMLLAAIWSYRTRFFPFLLVAFLWAGTDLPLSVAWTSGRWFILATGALVGLVIFIREERHRFAIFHFVAFFCVVAALISAAGSAYSNTALLKATSLLLLFLYGSCGARLAVMGRESKFFSKMLTGCEVLVYVTAIAYFGFQYGIYGNPNSLGAIMGVVVAPIMLWGILVSEQPAVLWRRSFAFTLTLLLLFSSYARAGIAAAVVSCVLLCLALRRYGLLIRGLSIALVLAAIVAAIVPLHERPSDSLTSTFVYKGRRDEGILASRRSVWDDAVSAIEEHPWFGSGFGTSKTSIEVVQQSRSFESLPQATREHGNSYLAITEWVGFIGDIPFLAMVILIVANLVRALAQMRRTGDTFSPLIPLTGVLAAGLVHAAFEDWLFAVGYYICIFFWTLAFIMVDAVPAAAPAPVPSAVKPAHPWPNNFDVAPSPS
jgi:O-antigen ligase